MKNRVLILAMLCALGIGMSRCQCQDCMPRSGAFYHVSAINNSDSPIRIDTYDTNGSNPAPQSDIVEPYLKVFLYKVVISEERGSQFSCVFVSSIDDTTIVDTTIVIEPRPFDGIDYETNMTLNADKTLTIITVPIVESDIEKKEIRF